MSLWSISFSYRLGLAFHALNNEGSDGSNLMQPRRIDVGNVTYDGISGEIIRRQILENFVNECRRQQPVVPMLPLSEGLHPDRGPVGIRAAARLLDRATLSNDVLYAAIRKAIQSCAVLDVGGYLAAWQDQAATSYIAEAAYIQAHCADLHRSNNRVDVEVVKRESCFDVAWLISEQPQDLTVTQHSAYRDTFGMNSRYAQTMRSNIYGGVIRADLHRVGTDDYWYLQNGQQRLAISGPEQSRRQAALVRSIGNFIAAPSAAKVAAWAPHLFLTEGAILLASNRTAPFASPIRVDLNDSEKPVQHNPNYKETMECLKNEDDTWVWTFSDVKELLGAISKVLGKLTGDADGKESQGKS